MQLQCAHMIDWDQFVAARMRPDQTDSRSATFCTDMPCSLKHLARAIEETWWLESQSQRLEVSVRQSNSKRIKSRPPHTKKETMAEWKFLAEIIANCGWLTHRRTSKLWNFYHYLTWLSQWDLQWTLSASSWSGWTRTRMVQKLHLSISKHLRFTWLSDNQTYNAPTSKVLLSPASINISLQAPSFRSCTCGHATVPLSFPSKKPAQGNTMSKNAIVNLDPFSSSWSHSLRRNVCASDLTTVKFSKKN